MSATKGPEYIIRRLQLSDCEDVRELWTDLGWNMIKYINEVMVNYETNGTFVAQELKTGKLIGVLSGFNISPDLAFIGQYGVKPEYQGQGIGSALWRQMMVHIGPQRNISLYTMPHMADKYRDNYNFKVMPKKRLIHLKGIAQVGSLIQTIPGISLSAIIEDNVKGVIEYDKSVCNGLDRSLLIQHTCIALGTIGFVALDNKKCVQGYCFLLPTIKGSVIVLPLYADNESIAELLLRKCVETSELCKTNELFYYTWDTNKRSVDIALKMGLEIFKRQPILFTKETIDGNMNKIFGVSSRSFYPF